MCVPFSVLNTRMLKVGSSDALRRSSQLLISSRLRQAASFWLRPDQIGIKSAKLLPTSTCLVVGNQYEHHEAASKCNADEE